MNKRANHSFCVGYDNVIAGLKGVILADHSYIAFNATHNAILGGAVHKIVVGDFSVIGGGYTNSILDGDYCVIVGGYLNTINVPGGGNCTVGGSNTTVTGSAGTAFGNFNTVTGIGGLAIGVEASAADGAAIGNKVTASGVKSLATGNLMTASGNYSRASGNNGTATADGAVSEGVLSHATAAYATARGLQAIARIAGQQAVANGAFAVAGDAQISDIVQRATTTSATVGSMPGYLLNPAQTVQYRVMVTARDTATGNSATWELKGAAKRIASAAAVAVGSSFPAATLIAADAGASGWACSASASTNSVVLLLTGAAATTIRWVARFEVVELGG
ncbi:hypothetical protein [Microbacterium sp. W4I20]|uniref:hypothetical protein n=1 Tax=Microbacterium sp. W4I20 TaxID=3042262 RepID=UPI0027807DC1|nr:hypothetical protein [Microbacterium sp. W4I20]MDQ0726791.1 hypothetical protein [Microbacterium sp. W4I20]